MARKPPAIEDAAFRYVRILRQELIEFSFLYVDDRGWIPPLSKLRTQVHYLAKRNPSWRVAADLVASLDREEFKNWDDVFRSRGMDSLIDWFRDAHAKKWKI